MVGSCHSDSGSDVLCSPLAFYGTCIRVVCKVITSETGRYLAISFSLDLGLADSKDASEFGINSYNLALVIEGLILPFPTVSTLEHDSQFLPGLTLP